MLSIRPAHPSLRVCFKQFFQDAYAAVENPLPVEFVSEHLLLPEFPPEQKGREAASEGGFRRTGVTLLVLWEASTSNCVLTATERGQAACHLWEPL